MALHLICFQPSTNQQTRKEAGSFLFPVSHQKGLGAFDKGLSVEGHIDLSKAGEQEVACLTS